MKAIIQKYKSDGVKPTSLPAAVKTEMVFGMTNEERISKYQVLSDLFKKNQAENVALAKKCVDGLKLVKNKNE